MISLLPILTSCFALSILALGAPAQQIVKGRLVIDKTHGYKMLIPVDWRVLPIHIDATRLAGWFHSKRRYNGVPESDGNTKTRRAAFCVVKLDKPVEGKSSGRVWDYAYRLSRQLRKVTYEVTKTDIEHESMNIVQWDVRVSGEAPNRWRFRAWEFSGPKENLVVEFRVLERYFPELEATAMRAMRSVRRIESTPLPKQNPILRKPFALRQWLKFPVLDRHRQRAAIGVAHEQYVLSRLPPDWTVHEGKHILLLSHSDLKTTKLVLNWIEAFHRWMQDRFGDLSTDYPIRTTIRLCANSDEYDSYRRSGGWRVDYNFANREIVMCRDGGNLNMDEVLWSVFRRYMVDIAPEVYFNMPVWLNQGLKGLISRARMKRNKLIFPSSATELGLYHELRRTKRAKIWTVIDLMNDPYFGYVPDKIERDGDLVIQSRVLLRFFDGNGKRCRAVGKGFLLRYCEAIRKLVRELDFDDPKVMVWDTEDAIRARLEQARDRDPDQSTSSKKISVPYLRDRWKAYLRIVRERKPEFMKELHARTCAWSRPEWTQVERGYERFYKSKSR